MYRTVLLLLSNSPPLEHCQGTFASSFENLGFREHLRLRLKTTSETEEQRFEASHGNTGALNHAHTNQSIVLALGLAKG